MTAPADKNERTLDPWKTREGHKLIRASWWCPIRRQGYLEVIGTYRMPEKCPKAWLRGVGPRAQRRELREAGRPPSARRQFARPLMVTSRKGGGCHQDPHVYWHAVKGGGPPRSLRQEGCSL